MISYLPNPVNWQIRVFPQPPVIAPPPVVVPPPAQPLPLLRPPLNQLAQSPLLIPHRIQECAVAMKYLALLGDLPWDQFPERPTDRPWPGQTPYPRAPIVAAFLVKIHEPKRYMPNLRDFLVEHPALVWLLGFPLVASADSSWGFDVQASLPTARHMGRVLRSLPNPGFQFLLDGTVRLLAEALPPEANFGDTISLDTKAILAWVQENNPKAYVSEHDRLTKTRQPHGDPDCKLGCKRKRNVSAAETTVAPATPTKNPVSVTNFSSSDEYFWGYGSGVVATKVDGWGEFVLAELTQTFDKGDPTYFFPLMAEVERRLGRKPRFGAFDAAFDPFYVFEYFHETGGFAAVPYTKRGNFHFDFDEQHQPLCSAGLGMPLKSTYISHTSAVEHEMGRHACPLLYPTSTGQTCPVNHKYWGKGGCVVTMATSIGARLRYTLDRKAPEFKAVYRQRTATERVNSQAKELGIERPYLRNQRSIINANTLIYIIINLRGLQRVRARQQEATPTLN